jgi:hypothetical protein
MRDGTYEGSMTIGHLTRRIEPFEAKTLTLKECCDTFDRLLRENMPDHQCRRSCVDWVTEETILGGFRSNRMNRCTLRASRWCVAAFL